MPLSWLTAKYEDQVRTLDTVISEYDWTLRELLRINFPHS